MRLINSWVSANVGRRIFTRVPAFKHSGIVRFLARNIIIIRYKDTTSSKIGNYSGVLANSRVRHTSFHKEFSSTEIRYACMLYRSSSSVKEETSFAGRMFRRSSVFLQNFCFSNQRKSSILEKEVKMKQEFSQEQDCKKCVFAVIPEACHGKNELFALLSVISDNVQSKTGKKGKRCVNNVTSSSM